MSDAKMLPMPREQYPSWKYFKVFPRASCDLNSGAPARCHSFFWARNGIYHALEALKLSRGAHVLVPAYVCTAAVDPFTAFGAEVDFYEVGRDCEPDFAEIETKIRSSTEVILAVHYFGFPQRIRAFQELCARRNLLLIEDCAHVLTGSVEGRPLGMWGDASVFSWRKFLPAYDGAELRLNRPSASLEIRWNRESTPFTLKVAKCLIDRTLEQSPGWMARLMASALESMKRLWRQAKAVPSDQALLELDSNQASFDPALLNQRISRTSRFLLRHSNIAAVVNRRRENYQILHDGLRSVPGVQPLHPTLPPDVCPWVYPLFFEGMPNAHIPLRKMGVPAVTWGGVRPRGVDARLYPSADFLYDNLVFLPIHQNLEKQSLDRIIESVALVAANGSLKTLSEPRAIVAQANK